MHKRRRPGATRAMIGAARGIEPTASEREERTSDRAVHRGLRRVRWPSMQLAEILHTLAEKLPVPVRRLAYQGGYAGLRLYWLLTGPSTSGVKCVLTEGERVLLVRHTYGPREWDLPGGSIGAGESPEAAARREMNE